MLSKSSYQAVLGTGTRSMFYANHLA